MVYRPPGAGGGITQPGMPSGNDYASRSARGDFITTNRDNLGSWTSYLDAIRRVPGSAPQSNTFTTPEDRASRPRPLPTGPRGQTSAPVRGGGRAGIGNTPAVPRLGARPIIPVGGTPTPPGRYGAAQESRAGTPEANYAAGLRTYGAGGRSAPNVGAVRNKGGYNERDQRIAARNSRANLAAGDEFNRVRLLGG